MRSFDRVSGRPSPARARPAPYRSVARAGARLTRRAVLGGALGVSAASLVLAAWRARYTGRVFPAVAVADVPLGGLTLADARARLKAYAQSLAARLITFSHEGQVLTPSLDDLGVTIGVEAALEAAYAIGREARARERLRAIATLARQDVSLPLPLTLDERRLDAWFSYVDREYGRRPVDARIVVDRASVAVVPDGAGVVVDRVRARERILAALGSLRPIHEALPTVAIPPAVRATDLEEGAARVARALADPVVVVYEDQTWQLEPTDLGAFVAATAEAAPSGAVTVAVEADEAGLADWLAERFGPVVALEPVDAVVGWNGERVVAIESSVNGIALEAREFAGAVIRSLLNDHAPVEIPVTAVAPTVDSTNLAALGITTRLAAGDSNYEGSNDGRATNLRIGANLLNSTLVPPGGAFAFNHAIGVIDAAKGYVDAPVIDGERIGRDIGGGICQVSTTAFRAAFLAGLPIVEWWPHTYRLDFYERDGWESGVDASILQPEGDPFGGGDFRFVNPTDAWLLVESWANATHVYVVLYGPDLGYQVEVSGPHYGATIPPDPDLEVVDPDLPAGTVSHTELPVEGVEVIYSRDVYDPKGTLIAREDFYTLYHSRGNVWRVSPDMAGQSPAGRS